MFEIWIIPVVVLVIYLLSSIKILREYERGVIFRLGRVLPQPKGPGIFLVFAPIDRVVRTSLRIEAMEVAPVPQHAGHLMSASTIRTLECATDEDD